MAQALAPAIEVVDLTSLTDSADEAPPPAELLAVQDSMRALLAENEAIKRVGCHAQLSATCLHLESTNVLAIATRKHIAQVSTLNPC